MPSPLDPETAPAIDAAQRHHVLTWEVLEEGDDLGEWLRQSFLADGRTALPDGAYQQIQTSLYEGADRSRGEGVVRGRGRSSEVPRRRGTTPTAWRMSQTRNTPHTMKR